MITIIKEPEFLALAKNPLALVLETDNHLLSAGVKSITEIDFNNGPVDGDTMTFDWGDNSVEFTFRGSPNTSGLELPEWDGITTLSDWIETILVPALQKNYTLNKDFTVGESFGNDKFIVFARAVGTVFNFSFSKSSAAINGSTRTTPGTNASYNANFSLVVQLYFAQKSETTYSRVELELPPITNVAKFNLSEILDNNVFASTLPDFGQTALKDMSEAIQKYYFEYAERFGADPQVQQITKSGFFYCIKGGLNKADAATNSFYTDVLPNKKFLTWAPTLQTIHPTQPIFLNYYHETGANFQVNVTATLADGSTATGVLFTKTTSANTLHSIPLTVSAIFTALTITEAVGFTVNISQQSTPANLYSETLSFKIESAETLEENYFLFRNSFGVYEVLRTTGGTVTKAQSDREDFKGFLNPDATVTERNYKNLEVSVLNSKEVQTGFLNKAAAKHFLDFLASDDVYEITGTHFNPVKVKSQTAQLYETDSGSFNAAKFTIEADINETSVSHV